MDASPMISGTRFAICPMCEASKMVFSGLYAARCPACDYEPDGAFLKTLRQIVTLPDAPETHRQPRGSEPNRKPSQTDQN